jgi:hypothetical protein
MKEPALQVLTANRLREGEVVYWKAGSWFECFGEAEIFADKKAAEAALAGAQEAVKARVVVNPYLFEVRREEGRLRPVKERELIRAAGPSVRHDLGKQASHVSL